jgi:hypothetical protein
MADKNPPADYLLCQVASGKNWVDKSAVAAIGAFHATWFAPQPARRPKPAIVIPFCIDAGPDNDPDEEQEALAMHWRRIVTAYGEFFYRYRVPHFAAKGIRLHDTGVHVDMVDWQPKLKNYVTSVIEKLRAA